MTLYRADHVEIYRSGIRRKWRWRYVAHNGNILADSGQGYADVRDAWKGVVRVTGMRPTPTGQLEGKTSDGLDPRYIRVEVTR